MEKVQWCAAQHSMDARDHVGLVAPTRCRINLHDLDTVIFLVEKLGCGMSIRKLASNFQNQKCKFCFVSGVGVACTTHLNYPFEIETE